MPDQTTTSAPEPLSGALTVNSCFACSPDNPRGLHLDFSPNERGEMVATWTPDATLEGFAGIVHGGIISTALDESMAKAVVEAGFDALTAELRVRFRQHVPPGRTVRVRGWIASEERRMLKTEAAIATADGIEHAHAWATFLVLRGAPCYSSE